MKVAVDASIGKEAVYAYVTEEGEWGYGDCPHKQSNKAELYGILRTLRRYHTREELTVYCDNLWAVEAAKRNMKGEPILYDAVIHFKNKFVLQKAFEQERLKIEWVKGHNGHPLNMAADNLATFVRRSKSLGIPKKQIKEEVKEMMQVKDKNETSF